MKKPQGLKDWDFVKNQKHDITRLLERNLNPKDYYYQCDSGVYTPAFTIDEWNKIINNK
jgi:predicted RNA-binding protein associated with RNAse of E/G family